MKLVYFTLLGMKLVYLTLLNHDLSLLNHDLSLLDPTLTTDWCSGPRTVYWPCSSAVVGPWQYLVLVAGSSSLVVHPATKHPGYTPAAPSLYVHVGLRSSRLCSTLRGVSVKGDISGKATYHPLN